MKYYRVLVLILIVFYSCTKELDIDLGENQSRLVVNSLLTPGKELKLFISKTSPILDNDFNIEGNTQISFFEDQKLLFDTTISGDSVTLPYKPYTNYKYAVKVKHPGFDSVTASDIIPRKVKIEKADLYFPTGVNASGEYFAEARITFTDPAEIENYYEIIIGPLSLNTSGEDYIITDKVIISEGDLDYNPTSLFFSDELFNGETYTILVKYTVGYMSSNGVLKPAIHDVILRSVSKDYYLYRKYWTRHAFNQQKSEEGMGLDVVFKGEPQSMYTNIQNGYGIFAAYSEDKRKFKSILNNQKQQK